MRISDWSSDVCSSDLVQALAAPGADHAGQPTAGDGVIFLYEVAMRLRVEQGERAFEDRADFIPRLQHIDGVHLHQRLQPFGQRRLAAAHRAKQVEDLLALLQSLAGVPQEAEDMPYRPFPAVTVGHALVATDQPGRGSRG